MQKSCSQFILFFSSLFVSLFLLSGCKRHFYYSDPALEPEVHSYLGQPSETILPDQAYFQNDDSQSTMQTHHAVFSEHTLSQSSPPRHVALLLPLQGPLGSSGRAVRNGFLAAYYQAQSVGASIPKLTILDTTESDITLLYQKALSQGADFVIGPLSRERLTALVQSQKLSVPTLGLNTVRHDWHQPSTLFQFALSPSSEAYQVTQKAWETGYRSAAVIAPNTVWGRSIAHTFIQRWQTLGGRLLAEVSYKDHKTLNADIKTLLNVDQSESRKEALEKTLHTSVHFTPRRRHDLDVIFIAALPVQARQIRPLIKFYYGASIPIYSISSVYSGIPSPRQDRDLNGILFCEAPWILKAPDRLSPPFDSIYQRILSTWPQEYRRHPKLYLFGVDAYRLMTSLALMQRDSTRALSGATGILYLNQGRIDRQLSWARFHQGWVRPID